MGNVLIYEDEEQKIELDEFFDLWCRYHVSHRVDSISLKELSGSEQEKLIKEIEIYHEENNLEKGSLKCFVCGRIPILTYGGTINTSPPFSIFDPLMQCILETENFKENIDEVIYALNLSAQLCEEESAINKGFKVKAKKINFDGAAEGVFFCRDIEMNQLYVLYFGYSEG